MQEFTGNIDYVPDFFDFQEVYHYGSRYYDCKLSRWISADPPLATGEYLPNGNKKHDANLPGMGGVFNSINLDAYQYCGMNPVKYVDPDGEKIINVDPATNNKVLEIITSVCGNGFYFDKNNELKYDKSKDAGTGFSPTARAILIKAIKSTKTTYTYMVSGAKLMELEEKSGSFGEIGMARRVKGESGNTVGIFLNENPKSGSKYIKSTFNISNDKVMALGFIHEVLGHAISDMGIEGTNSDSDVMEIERTIRAELGWESERKLNTEKADLSREGGVQYQFDLKTKDLVE